MRRIILCMVAALLLLTACSKTQESGRFAPSEEKRLVIYTSHKEAVYSPVIREFERRTGIWVQLETGGTNELLERLASGGTDCDLMFGGGVDSLSAYADCFTEYTSPDINRTAQNYRDPENKWTPFSLLPIVLIYNTKLVRLNPPTGWASLIDGSWKGSIAFADPAVSGSGYTALCTMLQALPGEPQELLKLFAENLGGVTIEDSGLVVGAVAEGKCYIGVTLEETALKAIAAGSDIALNYPKEGTSALPDGAAIVKGCAHEENARLFIDFLLSEEMQSILSAQLYRRSVYHGATGSEEHKLLDYDLNWAGEQKEQLLGLWNAALREAKP